MPSGWDKVKLSTTSRRGARMPRRLFCFRRQEPRGVCWRARSLTSPKKEDGKIKKRRRRYKIEWPRGSKIFGRYELHKRERRNYMKILTITAIIALPLMALGQTTEPQQTQEQTKDTQTTAPAKAKKMRPAQAEPGKPQAKPETGTSVRGQTNVQGRTQDMNRNEPGARSSTS